jgi:Uma2 family endonuclease
MATTAQKLTFQDYLRYVDGADTPYELVDGELVPMALGTGRHGAITEFLNDTFREEINRQGLLWTAKAMMVGVRSPRGRRWDTSRIPDVTVLPQAQWEAMANREAVIDLHEPPPLLVVEVVSPSTEVDDYRSKRSEYGLLDIPEYWIVDPGQERITLCVLDHQFYDSVEFTGNEQLRSPTFPNLRLTLYQLLSL